MSNRFVFRYYFYWPAIYLPTTPMILEVIKEATGWGILFSLSASLMVAELRVKTAIVVPKIHCITKYFILWRSQGQKINNQH